MIVFLVLAAVDLRARIVHWAIVVPATVAALAVGPAGWFSGLIGLATAATLLGLLLVVGHLLYQGDAVLGFGDLAVAALLGALAGFPGAFLAIAAGTILSGLGALLALVTRRASLRSYMPYGPGLCLGGIGVLCLIPSA